MKYLCLVDRKGATVRQRFQLSSRASSLSWGAGKPPSETASAIGYIRSRPRRCAADLFSIADGDLEKLVVTPASLGWCSTAAEIWRLCGSLRNAAQTLHLIQGGLQRRLSHYSHYRLRFALLIDLACFAIGTQIARLQLGMANGDPLCSPKSSARLRPCPGRRGFFLVVFGPAEAAHPALLPRGRAAIRGAPRPAWPGRERPLSFS